MSYVNLHLEFCRPFLVCLVLPYTPVVLFPPVGFVAFPVCVGYLVTLPVLTVANVPSNSRIRTQTQTAAAVMFIIEKKKTDAEVFFSRCHSINAKSPRAEYKLFVSYLLEHLYSVALHHCCLKWFDFVLSHLVACSS